MKWFITVPLLAGLYLLATTQGPTDPPVEVGAVNWSRDLDQAKKQSSETGKPVLILFQEIPG